jgi:hypothetical protein
MDERRIRDLLVWQLCIPMRTRDHPRGAVIMCKIVEQADSRGHIKHVSVAWSPPVDMEALLPESLQWLASVRDRTDESTLQNVRGGRQDSWMQRDAPKGFAVVKIFEMPRSCLLFSWTC